MLEGDHIWSFCPLSQFVVKTLSLYISCWRYCRHSFDTRNHFSKIMTFSDGTGGLAGVIARGLNSNADARVLH